MLKRGKLYTIVATVIEGYQLTLSNDPDFAEALKLRHLKVLKSLSDKFPCIPYEFGDDKSICLFQNTPDAIEFAIEVQTRFLGWPKMPVKIGIDYGRVAKAGETIKGKVLNIAQGVAESSKSGSVLITARVQSRIQNLQTFDTEFLDVYEIGDLGRDVQLYTVKNKELIVPEPEEIDAVVKELPPNPKKRKSSISHILISIGILIGTSALFAYLNVLSADKVIDDYSIAVLPFESVDNNEESNLISEALTKDILFNLSLVKDLYVISSYTIMNLKLEGRSPENIAKQLGVAYILRGSSHKFGDNLRVTVELLNVNANKIVWQDSYNRKYSEIMAIEAEISKEIVDALRLRLSFDEIQYLVGVPTGKLEAYNYFVEGRRAADIGSARGNRESIDLYSRAIRVDTTYAEAFVELANSNLNRVKFNEISAAEVSKLAEIYLTRARNINENIPRILTVEGKLYNLLGEMEKAEPTLLRAIEVSPNSVEARLELAELYQKTKRFEKQLEHSRVAYKLDPLNINAGTAYAKALIANEEYAQAETLLNNLVIGRSAKNISEVNRLRVAMYYKNNEYGKAIKPLLFLSKRDSTYVGSLGHAYAKAGDTTAAKQIIDSLRDLPNSEFKSYNIAKIYAGLDKRDSLTKYFDEVDVSQYEAQDSVFNFFEIE